MTTDPKRQESNPDDCWAVLCGQDHHLGAGPTMADAVDDALGRLLDLQDPTAYKFLLQLIGSIPVVFVGDYPPAGCFGLMRIPPHIYRAMHNESGIWTPQRPLRPFESE